MPGGRGRGNIRGNPNRPGPYNRGRGGGRGGHFSGPGRNSVFIPFAPFDLEHCAVQFPKVTTNEFDSQIGEMILERNKKIILSEEDSEVMSKIYEEISEVLGSFYTESEDIKTEDVKAEGEAENKQEDPQAIEDIRTVGAFANETLIDGVKELELLITMRNPMKIDEFGEFSDKLTSALPTYTISSSEEFASIKVESLNGFRANCYITCSGNKIKTSGESHLQKRIMYKNFDMGKRAKWFSENCVDPNIRLLARILSDFRVRFEGFRGMSQWAVELMAHYSMSSFDESGNQSIMPIPSALKRALMLLSSGFFLPGSAGIRDPAERDGRSVHQGFSKLDMDNICCAAQTLLRILMQGGGRKVFGLEDSAGLLDEMQVIDDVVIQPSVQCYVHIEEATPDPPAVAEALSTVKMEA